MISKLHKLLPILLLCQPSFSKEIKEEMTDKIIRALQDRIPYAEIRVPNLEKLSKTEEIQSFGKIDRVKIIEERSNGVAMIDLISAEGKELRIQTPYEALVKVPIAVHRIFPNTRLTKEDFRLETINVSTGSGKDYRGMIVFDLNTLDQVETKQTILENQFVLRSQIQKSPDLRKGETVQVEMVSGELSLITAGTVLENAYFGNPVRVLTSKTKKEISGKAREDHSVEVRL